MARPIDERDLERTLDDLGARLAYPKRDLWPAVRERIRARGRTPWWTRFALPRLRLAPVLATVAVLLVATFLLTPDLVSRAAQVLGLPAVQIYRVPAQPTPRATVGTAPTFAGQRVASLAEATALAGFAV